MQIDNPLMMVGGCARKESQLASWSKLINDGYNEASDLFLSWFDFYSN